MKPFKYIGISSLKEVSKNNSGTIINLIDSCPIVTCSSNRTPKVALETVDKSYCSSKKMWYHGVKLHALGIYCKGKLPEIESFIISKASENDITIFKDYWAGLPNRLFYADKIYINEPLNQSLRAIKREIITPIKAKKGRTDRQKQIDLAFEMLYDKMVSSVRQPIESFFNWLNEKTQIQKASKVRSSKGLLVHIFGRIAACLLFFNY